MLVATAPWPYCNIILAVVPVPLSVELMLILLVALSVSSLAFHVIGPEVEILPVLVTLTLPPPDWLIPAMASVLAVFVRAMFPLVLLVALKVPTTLAAFRVIPVVAVVVSEEAVIAPDPVIAPALAVSDTGPFTVKTPGARSPLLCVIDKPVKSGPMVPPDLLKLVVTVNAPVPLTVPLLMSREEMEEVVPFKYKLPPLMITPLESAILPLPVSFNVPPLIVVVPV